MRKKNVQNRGNNIKGQGKAVRRPKAVKPRPRRRPVIKTAASRLGRALARAKVMTAQMPVQQIIGDANNGETMPAMQPELRSAVVAANTTNPVVSPAGQSPAGDAPLTAGAMLKSLTPAIICAITGVKQEHQDGNQLTLRATGNIVVAEANNGSASVSCPLHGLIVAGLDGTITVNATDLKNMVSAFPADAKIRLAVENTSAVRLVMQMAGTDNFSSLPTSARPVAVPAVDPVPLHSCSMSMSELLSALTMFAYMGFEKFRPEFMHVAIRVRPNGYRVIAGDGARFVACEQQAPGVVATDHAFDLLVHSDHKQSLVKLLKTVQATTASISVMSMGQVVVRAGNCTIVLMGLDPAMKWPNELRFIDRPNVYRVVVPMAPLAAAVKAMMATYTKDMMRRNDIHTTTVTFDCASRTMRLESNSPAKAVRTIQMCDVAVGDGLPLMLTWPAVTESWADLCEEARHAQYVQLGLVDGTSPMVAHFQSGDHVQPEAWAKDPATGSLARRIVFFSAFNKKQFAPQ